MYVCSIYYKITWHTLFRNDYIFTSHTFYNFSEESWVHLRTWCYKISDYIKPRQIIKTYICIFQNLEFNSPWYYTATKYPKNKYILLIFKHIFFPVLLFVTVHHNVFLIIKYFMYEIGFINIIKPKTLTSNLDLTWYFNNFNSSYFFFQNKLLGK